MKRFITILLLFAFSAGFAPVVKSMFTGEAVCMTDMSEEDTKGEKEIEKKDIKESILSCINISVENICKPVYPHTSHFPGENPNSEILTPPPNQS